MSCFTSSSGPHIKRNTSGNEAEPFARTVSAEFRFIISYSSFSYFISVTIGKIFVPAIVKFLSSRLISVNDTQETIFVMFPSSYVPKTCTIGKNTWFFSFLSLYFAHTPSNMIFVSPSYPKTVESGAGNSLDLLAHAVRWRIKIIPMVR